MSIPNERESLQLAIKIITNLNHENISQSTLSITNLFDKNYNYSFDFIISQMIYFSFNAFINDSDTCLNFIKELEKIEEVNKSKRKIFDIFAQIILNKNTQESYYLINKMVKENLIELNIIQNLKIPYFVHYLSDDEIKKIIQKEEINNNHEELLKNNWELHKKLIKEGVNPNEIARIIRNDEIEKLQEISSQTKFNFNQKIIPSLYERCSFINKFPISLISYAAFFGSILCFKYLLMNGVKVYKTGKYAVAGGNIEIIHLCEQNHSSFEGAYEIAIQFYRNDIFKYLYENKLGKIRDLTKLGKMCILYHNYEILTFLEEEGINVDSSFISESAKIGNIFLVKYLLEFHFIGCRKFRKFRTCEIYFRTKCNRYQ